MVRRDIIDAFRPKFDTWNATFTMPYHVFRQRLKALALLSLNRVSGASLSRLDEVPAGHLIVPVDDDDWLAPDVAARLTEAFDPAANGYLWRRATVEWLRPIARLRAWMGPRVGRKDPYLCKTNSYAVLNLPDLKPLTLSHATASRYFEAHATAIRRIPWTLAVQNRNLASQTTLNPKRRGVRRAELVMLFEKHRRLYDGWRPTAELEWVSPYVAEMRTLMGEIRVR